MVDTDSEYIQCHPGTHATPCCGRYGGHLWLTLTVNTYSVTQAHMLLLVEGDTGATYTTAQGEPTLSVAWAGHGLLHLQLQSRIRLEQKPDTIIVTNASAACYTSEPYLCVPDSKMAYSGIQARLSPNPHTPNTLNKAARGKSNCCLPHSFT